MKLYRRVLQLAVFLLIAVIFTGCAPGVRPGQYTYRVSLDEALRDKNSGMMPSIEVDFVAVNESEKGRWETQDLDDYFSPGNVMRANCVRHTMAFTNDKSEPQVLPANDSKWQKWSGSSAMDMFIMASIPLSAESPSVDPRRLILPLDQARWNSGVIAIEIKPSGVVRLTPMRPLKKK
jgi:hypothetical protein